MQIKERKRFLDSALLNSGWFLKLTPDERLFWIMLQLRCDCIGQFDIDGELLYAERMHGLKIDFEGFSSKANTRIERIRKFDQGRCWLLNFIPEQYGQLNPNSNPHRRYIKDLNESGLMDAFARLHPDFAPKGTGSLREGYRKGTDSHAEGYGKGTRSPEEEAKEQEAEKAQEEEKDEEPETALSFERRSLHTRMGISDEELAELPFNR